MRAGRVGASEEESLVARVGGGSMSRGSVG